MDREQFLIDVSASVMEALRQLDKSSKKILFVTQNNTLFGSVSDGDIRRWLLSGGSLDASLEKVAYPSPVAISESEAGTTNTRKLLARYSALPIINARREIVDILFRDAPPKKKNSLHIPVVIMAGGLGTRLYPYTKILPKPLIPVGDTPILEHIIHRFCDYGCRKFYLIVNHKKNMIKAYFNETPHDYTIHYIDEERPLGTGGGLAFLKGLINETFFLTNCDILIEANYEDILAFHREKQNKATMVCSLKEFTVPYGVVEFGENGHIDGFREKPKLSFFTNTGFYVVEPDLLDSLEENVAIGFPDVLEKHLKAGENVAVFPISEKSWLDMGQPEELERMRQILEEEKMFE